MTEYIKKKRGRKPKNKINDNTLTNNIDNDIKSEDENIILHLPITMTDINNMDNLKCSDVITLYKQFHMKVYGIKIFIHSSVLNKSFFSSFFKMS